MEIASYYRDNLTSVSPLPFWRRLALLWIDGGVKPLHSVPVIGYL